MRTGATFVRHLIAFGALGLTCIDTSAWAVVCTPGTAVTYMAGWTGAPLPTNCNEIPATTDSPTILGTATTNYVLVRAALTPPNDVVTIGATNISYNGANAFGVIADQYLTQHGNSSINFSDVTAAITNTGVNGGIAGLITSFGVPLNGDNFTLTALSGNYTGGNTGGTVASYALLAGSTVDAGETASTNGLFSTITLSNNATIRQTYTGGLIQPVLNSGLRAIQGAYNNSGNGSSGKIEIKGTLDMTLTGPRIEGIYVSGAASDGTGVEAVSQVLLNDSSITLVKGGAGNWDSSAIKVGKSRAVGTGKGLVVSNGALTINMGSTFGGAQAYMSPAIKMAVSGSQLLANGPGSSANITAARSALAIGIDDWGSNVDSTGISAQFGKATLTTQSATAPLLMADSGQQGVQMLFDNQSSLTAATNGYLVDIIKYRASTTASSVALTLDHGSIAKGLTNQNYANSTLNVAVNNNSVWNLIEKTNGDKTSTYTTFGMTTGAALNAYKAGAAAFVMNGPLTSDASAIDLQDGTPGDVLTVQPSYAGSNGAALTVDTCLAGSGAASDVLKVAGDTSGTTVLKVTPFADAACPGADTTTTGDGKGILVVQVTGNSNAAFTLDGGAVTQGGYDYTLAKVGTDWYLQSRPRALTGTVVVKKTVQMPAGATAFNGSLSFTLTCTPAFTQQGTLNVIDNQGSAAPITVAAGSQCSVSETLPDAPTGLTWATPAYSQPGIVAAGQTATAVIANTLIRGKPLEATIDPEPVPIDVPLALGGLAALVALAAVQARRRRLR